MPIITITVLNLLEEWFKHEFGLVEFKDHLYCVKYSFITTITNTLGISISRNKTDTDESL